jgi:hypothetical protein
MQCVSFPSGSDPRETDILIPRQSDSRQTKYKASHRALTPRSASTDEAGLLAIEDLAHINDIHATVLHLMGLDHKQLTFLHNGRDERLTDVGGRVIKKLLA